MLLADLGRLFIGVVCVATTLAGCGASRTQDAEDVARLLFEAVRNKDYERALTLYGKKFFEKGSPQHWRQVLEAVNSKLGDLQSYKLATWKIERSLSLADMGIRYKLQYEVKYARYEAVESLVLFRPFICTRAVMSRHPTL